MRKHALLLAASLLFVPSAVGAMVIEPGTIEIGGGSGFNFTSATLEDGTSIDTTIFNISGTGAYYIMPNLGIGARFGYNSIEVESEEESGFSLGPVVKYSFPIAEQANIFGQASVGYYSHTYTDDSEATGWYGLIGAGASYFLSSSVSLDGMLNYEYDSLDFEGEDATISGFTLGAGITVYLR